MVVLLKQERRQQSADTHASGPEAARSALMSVPSTDPLTEQELDVLELLGARLSNNEIAGCLMISEPTVKRHAANAYRKLRVSHRRLAIPRPTTLGALPRRTSRRGVVPGPRVVPILGALGRHSDRAQQISHLRPPLTRYPMASPSGVSRELVVGPTTCELVILRLLADRLTNREIANELSISPVTVKRHTISLYRKLQAQDRRHAVERARTLELLPVGSGGEERLGPGPASAPVYPLRHRSADLTEAATAMSVIDKGQLTLAGLIHDLRNPLTAIHAYAQVLRSSLDRDGGAPMAPVEGAVSGILVSASRMTTMLEDMLPTSRSGIGGDSTATSLAAVLNLSVEQVGHATGQRRVHLVQPARPISGPWDCVRVARALVNVLENALKYSPDGGPVLVTARDDGAEVEVTIRDQGIGIPEAELPLLFNGFVRGSNARERFAGTGLGLASSRQLIESQGGSLEIASVEGRGTTVTIRLPR